MIDLTTIAASLALCWTIFQQYQISKICEKCPFLPPNAGKGGPITGP